MFSIRVRVILLFFVVLLACQTSCKGPFTYETHPVIWVSVSDLSFSAAEVGPNPAPKTIQIKNAGIQTLDYTVAASSAWANVTPGSGSSSGQINEHLISVEKDSLAARTEPYSCEIFINSSQACNSPQKIIVTLQLSSEPPAEIAVSPGELTFATSVGGANPAAQTIRIRNSGQGTLNYTLSDDSNWLEVSPSSGSSSGDQVSHSVSVISAGLGTGTYSGTITISDPNALNNPQTVSVTLAVGTALPPAISISPEDLRFEAMVGGANPPVQRVRIRNSGQGTLNYAVTADAAWLTVSPASGTSTGQEVSHDVSVSVSGLGQGSYEGLITVSSPNATNSPRVVRVTLVMGAVPTNNQIWIACDPSSGQTGAVIGFPIAILGNTTPIKAFGLEVTFDPNAFEFVGVDPGNLTSSWGAGFAGSLKSPGLVRIGGYGGTLSIPSGSTGTLAVLKLRVTCGSCSDGNQSQVCIGNFTDDISSMTTAPACATFTYRE